MFLRDVLVDRLEIPYHMVHMYILSENEDECTNLNSRAPSMSYQFGHQLDQRELR